MEYLDIVDEHGLPTGRSVERARAHREGIPHRTAHVWIFREHEDQIQVLLQKRCMDKDSFPGCYDISSAGHIPAGVEVIPSALRELQEELSLAVRPEEIEECGKRHIIIRDEFRSEPYVDNQYSTIFVMWKDIPAEDIQFQKEEIESVMWIEFEKLKKAILENTLPNCIDMEELGILDAYLNKK